MPMRPENTGGAGIGSLNRLNIPPTPIPTNVVRTTSFIKMEPLRMSYKMGIHLNSASCL